MIQGRWLRWLAAGSLVIAMMGADGSCDEDKPAPNTGSGVVDKTKAVSVQNTGKGRTRDGKATPYHVVLRITDTSTGETQTVRKDSHGDRFHYVIEYNRGSRYQIRLKVYGGASDVFDCKIYDGPDNIDQDHGLAQAYCELFTAR